jgi:hypothetical protein
MPFKQWELKKKRAKRVYEDLEKDGTCLQETDTYENVDLKLNQTIIK